jgi:adenine-specific DNA methylase
MIPKDCKRLAEVDFPIAEVSKHAAREKSIRHGHPSTLHLWWARRPLASSRAVLLALLWPDPCDLLCPAEFKAKARELLPQVGGCNPGATDEDLRKALLKFIADFANWDNAAQRTYLDVSRALVKAAHGKEPPLVVDPFAGGGSIPLETLRLGCETFASDLNPVACLILKVMLEDIPRQDANFSGDLNCISNEIRDVAERQIAEFYPPDADGARPVAYFWARTVRCESPQCGLEIPLMSSFWLSKKATHRRALRPVIQRDPGEGPSLSLELFEPANEGEVPPGTARNGRAQCPCCGGVIPPKRLQALMEIQSNGLDVKFNSAGERMSGARLIAVACARRGIRGREYRLSSESDYEPVLAAQRRVSNLATTNVAEGITAFPNEPVNPIRPSPNARGISAVTRYGVKTFSDLFNARQKLSLYFLASAIRRAALSSDRTTSAACELVAAALGKRADYSSGGTRWHLTFEKATCTFSKQALSQTWDYVEPTAVGSTSGSYGAGVETVLQAVETLIAALDTPGQTSVADACHSTLPDASAAVWFTDPPYYDAIPYADLSDFFYVWLKRALPSNPRLFMRVDSETGLTPKREECVWNRAYFVDDKPKDGAFFEECAASAFAEGRRVLRDEGIGGVVFAHKTTEGWEALLSGLVRGGWVITASWPIATERSGRLQSQGTAALATSVHLVCRPRSDDVPVGDWANVLRELPNRVGDWMERLQGEGVRGADLVFACIGPALEIFSRYTKVETADGRAVGLAEYLEKVWEVVGRSALAQVLGTAEGKARKGAAGAVEEDARLTALFLWTLQSTNGEAEESASDEGEEEEPSDEDDDEEGSSRGKAKGFTLVFDVVRRFAQPLGIELPKWEGRVIETKKGVVRLLPIAERAKQLFGEDGAQAVAARLEQEMDVGTNPLQGMLFPDMRPSSAPAIRGRGRVRGTRGNVNVSDESLAAAREATTLDRVHAAMLLQAGGRTNALRALLKAEQDRGPDFLRLANAFSALYPKGSEEKRLIDAMLLAVPR